MADIVIRNGTVVDGTGRPAYKADVAIQNGQIADIRPDITEPAQVTIDASGLVVTPGFIDCHNHSDDQVFLGTNSHNSLEQGVTTQITGNCGMSPAPYYEGSLLGLKRWLGEEGFASIRESARSMHGFLDCACSRTVGTNMAFFVGHNNLRGKAMGFDPGPPDTRQLGQMQEDLQEAMEAGCLGLSSGLVYAPSVYAQTDELIALAKTIASYGGIYATHVRGEAARVVKAVEEAIHIGEEAGVQVQISHLKVIGKDRAGWAQQLLEMIEKANQRGIRVYADQYPFDASSASLRALIPPRFQTGGLVKTLELLRDPASRNEIETVALQQTDPFESGIRSAGWDGILLSTLPKTPELTGHILGELARERGVRPMDLFSEILLANDGLGQGIYLNQNEQNMHTILAHPLVFGGTDSSNHPDEGIPTNRIGGRHPRGVSGMVRRLQLQRELGLCSMEEAIRRMTGAPAKAFGLDARGVLQKGCCADIAVLDYNALRANNSYMRPYLPNTGICYVLVNGCLAVENGHFTGKCAGRILRKK